MNMFCSKCGKEIKDEAVVCTYCGCATANFNGQNNQKDTPIIINNNNSASSSSAASAAVGVGGRVKRKYSLLFDIIMICFTGGLWILWMIFRPKYY